MASASPIVVAFLLCTLGLVSCSASDAGGPDHTNVSFDLIDSSYKTIHVMVALCDNENQGIVPVPAKLGKGDDLKNNLYWGALYGVKSYFKRSAEWELVKVSKAPWVLERLVFKHKREKYFLVADAWNGRDIKFTTLEFLQSVSGRSKDTLHVQDHVIGIHGNAHLIAYVGHDGLMERIIDESVCYKNEDGRQRDVIVLACFSKAFFGPPSEGVQLQSASLEYWTYGT